MGPGVLVFVMSGCPACHDYTPRFKRLAAAYEAKGMPVRVLDITKDKRAAALADSMRVKATPTTVVHTRGGKTLRRIGSLPDPEIAKLLAKV